MDIATVRRSNAEEIDVVGESGDGALHVALVFFLIVYGVWFGVMLWRSR